MAAAAHGLWPEQPETAATPSASGASVTSPPPGDLRGRLAAALQGTSPANARLVENAQTSLTPVAADWLSGWQILDVQNQTPPHPQRFFVALSDDRTGGGAVRPTGRDVRGADRRRGDRSTPPIGPPRSARSSST